MLFLEKNFYKESGIIELYLVLAVLALNTSLMYFFQNFGLSYSIDGTYYLRWKGWLLASLPVLMLYFFTRVFLTKKNSFILTSITLSVISIANYKKVALTNQPLSGLDFLNLEHLKLSLQYIENEHILLLCIALLIIIPILDRGIIFNKRYIIYLIILYPLCFSSHHKILNDFFEKIGIYYGASHWKYNIERNGLWIHLIQTSRHETLIKPEIFHKASFQKLIINQQTPSASKIFFILCESCFYSEKIFKNEFNSLIKLGFTEARGISPIYGGGTPNAEFEILTGLPANNNLTRGAIILQDFLPLLQNVKSIPSLLSDLNYTTYYLHNHTKDFWSRNIAEPKIGFKYFYDITDMQLKRAISQDPNYFSRDYLLFNKALSVIDSQKDKSIFMHLTTAHTHGPYIEKAGDFGELDFKLKLKKTITDLVDFVKKIKEQYPDSFILIYADHKPALTGFFHASKLFDDNDFDKIGSTNDGFLFKSNTSQEKIGDVPILLMHKDSNERLKNIQNTTFPLYCLSQIVSNEILNISLPSMEFSKSNVCSNTSKFSTYEEKLKEVPTWLIYYSLFDK